MYFNFLGVLMGFVSSLGLRGTEVRPGRHMQRLRVVMSKNLFDFCCSGCSVDGYFQML